jgi:hypothetical protein
MAGLVLAAALVSVQPTIEPMTLVTRHDPKSISQTAVAEFGKSTATEASLQERTAAPAREREPVRYELRIPAPWTHYIEVEATYPTEPRPSIELMMAVFWRYGEMRCAPSPSRWALCPVMSGHSRSGRMQVNNRNVV